MLDCSMAFYRLPAELSMQMADVQRRLAQLEQGQQEHSRLLRAIVNRLEADLTELDD